MNRNTNVISLMIFGALCCFTIRIHSEKVKKPKIKNGKYMIYKENEKKRLGFMAKTRFNDSDIRTLASIAKWISLLKLSGCQMTESGFAYLDQFRNLAKLYLNKNPRVKSNTLKHIRNLKKMRYLYLNQTKIGNKGMLYLKSMSSLIELDLSETKVGNKGLTRLEKLEKIQNLKIEQAKIDDEALISIGKLKALIKISLKGNNLTGTHLGELNELENLQELTLKTNRINNTNIKLLESKTLIYLDLAGNVIGDEGLEHIASMNTLKSLNLKFNVAISNIGLEYLHKLKQLNSIDLTDTSVTSSGISDLEKALPELQITW